MAAIMETLAHVASVAASIGALLAPPVVAAGLVPRLGPGRAIALGLRSRLFPVGSTLPQRAPEVKHLQRMVQTAAADQYSVVQGPKGVGESRAMARCDLLLLQMPPTHAPVPRRRLAGKTCIINTAMRNKCGIVRVSVAAGSSQEKIVADVLLAVTRSRLRSYDQSEDARRVLWFHHLFFRVPATVILQASERDAGKGYAAISSSCRSLVGYGLRVVVDASHNALSESAVATLREQVLQVEAMSRVLVEDLEGLRDLHAALHAAGLADVVWAVTGGIPAHYFKLRGMWDTEGCGDITAVATAFVEEVLGKAVGNRSAAVAANKRLVLLFVKFAANATLPASILEELELVRTSPDKVL